jgi:hypothetical protein
MNRRRCFERVRREDELLRRAPEPRVQVGQAPSRSRLPGPTPSWAPESPVLQAKLEVSEPGDPLELEAERAAEQVMREPEPAEEQESMRRGPRQVVQRKCACGGSSGASGEEKCAECAAEEGQEEEKKKAGVQRKAADSEQVVDPAATVAPVLATAGAPLDPAVRAALEPRFGHDFSRVRVHADAQAAGSAQDIHARAYTVGEHIVFATGEYAPSAPRGRRLLAHELTHVIQQQAAPRAPAAAAGEEDE